nr:proline-rich protein 36-like [Aegilops tauschii subsp. strangulata]
MKATAEATPMYTAGVLSGSSLARTFVDPAWAPRKRRCRLPLPLKHQPGVPLQIGPDPVAPDALRPPVAVHRRLRSSPVLPPRLLPQQPPRRTATSLDCLPVSAIVPILLPAPHCHSPMATVSMHPSSLSPVSHTLAHAHPRPASPASDAPSPALASPASAPGPVAPAALRCRSAPWPRARHLTFPRLPPGVTARRLAAPAHGALPPLPRARRPSRPRCARLAPRTCPAAVLRGPRAPCPSRCCLAPPTVPRADVRTRRTPVCIPSHAPPLLADGRPLPRASAPATTAADRASAALLPCQRSALLLPRGPWLPALAPASPMALLRSTPLTRAR